MERLMQRRGIEVREPCIDAETSLMWPLPPSPELISFPEAMSTIARAAGRDIAYRPHQQGGVH